MSNNSAETQRTHLPAGDPAWLAKVSEPILDPNRSIVDAHHHLWGPPRSTYLLDEFVADLNAGHKVIATIFADCSEGYRNYGPEAYRAIGETEFALEVAVAASKVDCVRTDVNAGIISRADLGEGDAVRGLLEAHIQAGKGRFKGIRFSSAWDPSPEIRSTARTPPERLLYEPKVRQGAKHVASLGLVLDLWVYHHQLRDVADFAAALPDVSMVLNHVGGPLGIGQYSGRRAEIFDLWKAGITEVAKCPNVAVKLGGLGMRLLGFGFENGASPPSSEMLATAWRPYVETSIEAFGTGRGMFESNFPVDQISCSYAVLWNAYKRLAQKFSEEEKEDLFSRSASRIYKLEPDAENFEV
jgi:L-fuconolactonase